MQAKEIIGLMKGDMAYTEDTLLNLKSVLEEYPYFQAAQLLYTLNLQATKDSCFNAELRKAACYSGDRWNLFYRTKSDLFPPEWIKRLDKKEESSAGSSFDLVDFFLTGQKTKEKKATSEMASSEKISTDYVTYMLSELPDDGKPEAKPLQHQDTIDKFLTENEKSPVRIVLKNESEELSNIPFSDMNTVEEDRFFSETLAKIYLKQKKYEKALEIIRKLYLLYPEKNRYFADQIRFLEKLVINTKK